MACWPAHLRVLRVYSLLTRSVNKLSIHKHGTMRSRACHTPTRDKRDDTVVRVHGTRATTNKIVIFAGDRASRYHPAQEQEEQGCKSAGENEDRIGKGILGCSRVSAIASSAPPRHSCTIKFALRRGTVRLTETTLRPYYRLPPLPHTSANRITNLTGLQDRVTPLSFVL